MVKRAKKILQRITAWSYSRYSTYKTCPRKAKHSYIDKMKEPASKPMLRGKRIHKLAEDYLLGKLRKLPEELWLFKKQFVALKKRKPHVEGQWAFDKDWKSCGWFDAEAWCRMVIDVADERKKNKELRIVDHKTGQIREEQMEQLELYGIGGLLKYPWVEKVVAKFWYLDQGEEREVIVHRGDLEELISRWEHKTKALLKDTSFAPKPNRFCGWCFFSEAKNGPCEY